MDLPFAVLGRGGVGLWLREQGASGPTAKGEEDSQQTQLGKTQSGSPVSLVPSSAPQALSSAPAGRIVLPRGPRRMLGCVEVFFF